MATLEQQRAAFALGKIESVQGDKAKFKTQLLKLPARLHSNGLGQTVAFYLSAGKGPEVEICKWLEEWLNRPGGIYPRGTRLIANLTGAGIDGEGLAEAKYREASAEVRVLAVWLKRFAEAFLEGRVE